MHLPFILKNHNLHPLNRFRALASNMCLEFVFQPFRVRVPFRSHSYFVNLRTRTALKWLSFSSDNAYFKIAMLAPLTKYRPCTRTYVLNFRHND